MFICGNKTLKIAKEYQKMLQCILSTTKNILCVHYLGQSLYKLLMKSSSYIQGKRWYVFLTNVTVRMVRNVCIKKIPKTESDMEEIVGLQTNCYFQTIVPLSDKTYLFHSLFLWRVGSLVISIKSEGVCFPLFFLCLGWIVGFFYQILICVIS